LDLQRSSFQHSRFLRFPWGDLPSLLLRVAWAVAPGVACVCEEMCVSASMACVARAVVSRIASNTRCGGDEGGGDGGGGGGGGGGCGGGGVCLCEVRVCVCEGGEGGGGWLTYIALVANLSLDLKQLNGHARLVLDRCLQPRRASGWQWCSCRHKHSHRTVRALHADVVDNAARARAGRSFKRRHVSQKVSGRCVKSTRKRVSIER
jgi:hypothetical protein